MLFDGHQIWYSCWDTLISFLLITAARTGSEVSNLETSRETPVTSRLQFFSSNSSSTKDVYIRPSNPEFQSSRVPALVWERDDQSTKLPQYMTVLDRWTAWITGPSKRGLLKNEAGFHNVSCELWGHVKVYSVRTV